MTQINFVVNRQCSRYKTIATGGATMPGTILTNASDFYVTVTGETTVYALDGNDTINAGGSSPGIFYGGDGNDFLTGGLMPDVLYGGESNDGLYGDVNSDYIEGGGGNDAIYGGPSIVYTSPGHFLGTDSLYGGAGNDVDFCG
ncbi:calcium-binding protein [Bradyrhizobium sp. 13971]